MADLARVRIWADALIALHLDPSWSFDFDHARTRAGACHYGDRRITVSRHLAGRFEDDEIHQVLTWPATHEQVVAASRLVPDDVVQRCTASGEPDEVVAKVGEYVAAGCTCPILYPLGPDVDLMLDTFAR